MDMCTKLHLKQLKEDEKKLLKPPPCVEDLLNLLVKVHCHLGRVSTRPIKSTKDVLQPLMKVLMAKELRLHPNKDVKTYVTSCLCEVLRITTPDFPYSSEVMEIIFNQIVEAFDEFPNVSSLSYQAVIEILKSFSKARLYKEMTKLGFETLIDTMFFLFFTEFRSKHSPEVFLYLETIMSSFLKESNSISSGIIGYLMFSVRNRNQNVSPFFFELGEKVLRNSADNLGSHLVKEMLSSSHDMEDYSQVVTSICQNASPTFEQDYLEKQLKDYGKKLLNPPQMNVCMIELKDDLVMCAFLSESKSDLKRVSPRPIKSTKDALEPLMKALIAEELLLHYSIDVKVKVISCIGEVSRITAPDPPYSSQIMEIIYKQITEVSQKLPHVFSGVFETLEDISKSDLSKLRVNPECDALITKYIKNCLMCLNNVGSERSSEVLPYIETIMCSILNDREEIPSEILSALLNSVRIENQNSLPSSFMLGEKVLTSCANKLNSDLLQAVGSFSTMDLRNYAQIVTSICQNASETLNDKLDGCNIQIPSPNNKRSSDAVHHFDPVAKR